MKLPKLTAFFLCLLIVFITSCESSDEVEKENIYYGSITMTGAQETPPVTTTATGTIDANYNRLSKTLSYTVTFSGLSDSATAAHIHGVGEAGILAPIMQTFSNFPRRKAGTYNGTLFIDEIKFTESNLLAHRYYINIHSKTYGGGEIRGQLILAKRP